MVRCEYALCVLWKTTLSALIHQDIINDCIEIIQTYASVCADVHLQTIVLAECLVTVRALVRTLTWGTIHMSAHETTASTCRWDHTGWSLEMYLKKVSDMNSRECLHPQLGPDFFRSLPFTQSKCSRTISAHYGFTSNQGVQVRGVQQV